jgi:hypothetical protein
MVAQYYFNFSNFKTVMEVNDADEATYGLILRSIFSHIKQVYSIDIESSVTPTIVTATNNTIDISYDATITSGMAIENQEGEIVEIASITDGTSIVLAEPFTSVPTSVTVYTTLVPFDLQYAIYVHAKFLFESQKKNTSILDSVSDASGSKATYRTQPPAICIYTYTEYSPNAVAFI